MYTEADHACGDHHSTQGVSAWGLDAEPHHLLRRLLSRYTARAPHALDSVLDESHFAWAGHTDEGQPHYYRIQSDGILVEYNYTQRNGHHAHSVGLSKMPLHATFPG